MESHHQILGRSKDLERFAVDFEVANHGDIVAAQLGLLRADRVRLTRVSGFVDLRATQLVLPGSVVTALGLQETGWVPVRCAEGRQDERALVGDVLVQIQGRSGVFTAFVEPNRTDALIGTFVLVGLDLVPDGTGSSLVPRDPRGIFSEIE